ncbi:MAG: deoxyribodipyrimidine photo-lyase [Planctomycetota bacterium]
MPAPAPATIVWLKRDLRIDDHTALAQAVARGPAVGLYVYEPEVIGAAEHDASHLEFVNGCLREVRAAMAARGGRVLVRRGRMPDVLAELRAAGLLFDAVHAHEETGLEATFERDKRVTRWCAAAGVRFVEFPQFGVVRPLAKRDGWARKWARRMNAEASDAPPRIDTPASAAGLADGEVLGPARLGLPASEKDQVQPPGERAAWDTLSSFLYERGERYRTEMSSPVDGWDGCSRLSAHLAYGAISMRRVHHATEVRLGELSEAGVDAKEWRGSITSFAKRLRWHCHFTQKLEDEPAIEHRNINRAYDGMRVEDQADWDDEHWRRFEAWCAGRTGYPMVDACMRCLRRTGWINFRMRAMLASFASYHLWLHWKPTAQFLAHHFLDFEPGIHYPQFQMQSGVTGINTVRIYSPTKQAKDQDPTGVFIRRWIPHLREVPDEFIAEPWTMPALTQQLAGCSIGEDYPSPIVEHRAAYASAKARVYAVKGSAPARTESTRVYEKHGSRQRPPQGRAMRA